MKRLVFLVSCTAALLSAADLSGVRNVYILKMSKGLDQYLANHLTREHLFQVVTDPSLADAILTDHIGESFEAKFNELYPPPEPEKPAKEEKDAEAEAKKAEKPKGWRAAYEAPNADADAALFNDTAGRAAPPISAFGGSKGMVFLVDTKSKQVIWSSFDPPRDNSSRSLDRAAGDIVGRIKRDLNPKK